MIFHTKTLAHKTLHTKHLKGCTVSSNGTVYGRGYSIQWNLSIEDTIGPSWLSCIQWNLSIEDTIGTQLAVLYTVELLYSGHQWDPAGCPVYSGTSL